MLRRAPREAEIPLEAAGPRTEERTRVLRLQLGSVDGLAVGARGGAHVQPLPHGVGATAGRLPPRDGPAEGLLTTPDTIPQVIAEAGGLDVEAVEAEVVPALREPLIVTTFIIIVSVILLDSRASRLRVEGRRPRTHT